MQEFSSLGSEGCSFHSVSMFSIGRVWKRCSDSTIQPLLVGCWKLICATKFRLNCKAEHTARIPTRSSYSLCCGLCNTFLIPLSVLYQHLWKSAYFPLSLYFLPTLPSQYIVQLVENIIQLQQPTAYAFFSVQIWLDLDFVASESF